MKKKWSKHLWVWVSLVFTFAIQSTSFRSFDKKHKTQATYLPQTRKRINVQSQRRQSCKRVVVVVGEEEEEVSKQYQYQMRKENLINWLQFKQLATQTQSRNTLRILKEIKHLLYFDCEPIKRYANCHLNFYAYD